MGTRVLVVEDDRDIRSGLKEILEIEGFDVRCAADGRSALEALGTPPPPEVIVLDVMMPGMGGLEFRRVQLAHADIASIPVVVLSADARIAERARELAANAWVRKPFAFDELVRAIEDVLSPNGASVA